MLHTITHIHTRQDCTLDVKQLYPVLLDGVDLKPLCLHCGVGAGSVELAVMGGVDDHWEMIIDGDPLKQASSP
jgi:hypothetical protein